MFGLDVDTLRRIREVLARFPLIDRVLIYGSRAMGNYRRGSDIDLTILGRNLSRSNTIYPLYSALDDLNLPYTFDLSILAELGTPDFVEHILRTGKVFYENFAPAKGWIECTMQEACNIEYGTRITRRQHAGTLYPVYGGGGETFRTDTFNREDKIVIARFAMSEVCTRFVKGKFFLNDSGLTLAPKDNGKLYNKFLDYMIIHLNDAIYALGRGTGQRNLNMKAFRELNFRYPEALSEQRRIVAQLDKLCTAAGELEQIYSRRLANMVELRRSLLKQAFAGRLVGDDGMADG